MTLEQKLRRIKTTVETKTEQDWNTYKLQWVADINLLYSIIMNKWLNSLSNNSLMEFSILPVKMREAIVEEYITAKLEISLPKSSIFFLIEPIAAVTTEYDGKLEFSMLGSYNKKVTILRKLDKNGKADWIIATSYKKEDQTKLSKIAIENIIEKWLF
jgi:hypothetical protein